MEDVFLLNENRFMILFKTSLPLHYRKTEKYSNLMLTVVDKQIKCFQKKCSSKINGDIFLV